MSTLFTTINDGRSDLFAPNIICQVLPNTHARLKSTFILCTEVETDASRYIGIWVDGVQVALESRYLDVEDGPTSLRRVCHPQRASGEVRARHPSDYRGGVAEVWVGEPPPVAIGQSVSWTRMSLQQIFEN